MSTPLSAKSQYPGSTVIQPDSLLEYLYTNLTLDQLKNLLNSQPDDSTLDRWNVQLEEFRNQVRIAIEYVTHD